MSSVLNAIQQEAFPLFDEFNTPEKITARFTRWNAKPGAYQLEAIAMSFVLLRDSVKAQQALDNAIKRLLEDGRQWCLDMADRLRGLLDQMNADFEAFRSQLPKWREENLRKMGLLEFAAPVEI